LSAPAWINLQARGHAVYSHFSSRQFIPAAYVQWCYPALARESKSLERRFALIQNSGRSGGGSMNRRLDSYGEMRVNWTAVLSILAMLAVSFGVWGAAIRAGIALFR